jgi:hypothetical protein
MSHHFAPYTQMVKSTDINKRKAYQAQKRCTASSPLSPLLSNIKHEVDKEMEQQGLKRVRYADDFSIYCKSNHAARKTCNNVFLYLKDKLKLPINRGKAAYVKPVQITISCKKLE